ncbi:Uncharacterised protein [Klebsiella variicola]|nr:Uncharacterised protein [Klebsiella variicola]
MNLKYIYFMVCLVKRMEMVLALDVLMLREEWGSKNPARWPGQLDLVGRGALLPW